MKKLLFLFFALCSSYSFGQTGNFNTLRVYYGAVFGSQLRDPSAMVDIQGTTGGFLCPRLTTTERNAIPSPATGLMIYNTSTGAFNWYNGSGWSVVGTEGGTVTSVSGTANRITSTGGATPVIDISASYVGQSSITTLGTVTTGTWNGSVLGVAYGGTALSSYAIGDIIYASGATTLAKLPIGTASQQLRVNAGATALEYFTPASSGITIGGTAISGGTDNRILFQDATASDFVTQTANFTMGAVSAGFLDVPTGYAIAGSLFIRQNSGNRYTSIGFDANNVVATNSTYVGYQAGKAATGVANVALGDRALTAAASDNNTAIGQAALFACTGTNNTALGINSGFGISSGSYNTNLGGVSQLSNNVSSSNTFGYATEALSSHVTVIASNTANGYSTDVYFNGQSGTTTYPINLRTADESGTDQTNTANIFIRPGYGTGTGIGAYTSFWSGDAGSTGTAVNTPTEKARITAGGDIVVGITSDTVGFVLKSPNGHYWRLSISDLGVISWTDLGTSIPN